MHLEFYGAAGGVTGSLHRLCVGGSEILLDCGLFQGHRAEANALNRSLPRWAIEADVLILSHAHLDHTGSTPTLVKRGFQGNIYCSASTRDLCSAMLRDSAMLQEQDARYLNRRLHAHEPRIEPLYTMADAQTAVAQMVGLPFHRAFPVAKGVTLTLHNAGHVLGSCIVQLDLEERGIRRRLVFTGDLGRAALPLMQDPEVVNDANVLLIESTYGDRLHPEVEALDAELASIIQATVKRGGKVFIPTFALERAQEVLFTLERISEAGKLPNVPIYIDSPLAIAVTEIYKLHPESLSEAIQARILKRNDPFSPPGVQYVSDVESSKAIQRDPDPSIVIAGSGMCEGGRILHHFRAGIVNPKNAIVTVGFMAEHTLGRRIVDGQKKVRILGDEYEVRAQVHSLGGLSAHADRNDLLAYVKQTGALGHLTQVVLVHGENGARKALEEGVRELGTFKVLAPERGDTLEL